MKFLSQHEVLSVFKQFLTIALAPDLATSTKHLQDPSHEQDKDTDKVFGQIPTTCIFYLTSLMCTHRAFWSKATASAQLFRCSWYLKHSCSKHCGSSFSKVSTSTKPLPNLGLSRMLRMIGCRTGIRSRRSISGSTL